MTSPLQGQEGHYWTEQYGTRSMLLSGSVIGGVEDLGAVFYNPARLGQVENPSFLLSADVYQISNFTIEDGVQDGVDTKNTDFGGVPSMFAGTFKIKAWPEHQFAYYSLQRARLSVRFNFRNESRGEVLDDLPGTEIFEAETRSNSSFREEWFGLTWSHKLSDNISVGVSANISILNSRKSNELFLRAFLEDTAEVGIYEYRREFRYNVYGFLWKAGLAYQKERLSWGLTIRTPHLNIINEGKYNYQEYYSGFTGSSIDGYYANSYQSGLKVRRKTPFAIGGGVTYSIKEKNKIHFSTEFFNGVNSYDQLVAKDHIAQSNPEDTISFKVVERLRPVINFGIGLEWYINKNVSGYASTSTDFSAIPDDAPQFNNQEAVVSNALLNANFLNIGGGIVLNFRGADITLGATHTGGSRSFERPFSFPEDGGGGTLETNDEGRVRWNRWRIVFSFSVPFVKSYTKKLEDKLQNLQKKN
ncbi:hypothetical protein GCM10023331_30730 [Algivirga pacifica]|uniref:Long-chain fatty acid transport protein n=2 Tax=Algivirga pacifica TaxID=1162670 RepID=A0ABP9DHR5_9BACT